MRWFFRGRQKGDEVDTAIDEAKGRLEHVRHLAREAIDQAAAAQDRISALTNRTEPNA